MKLFLCLFCLLASSYNLFIFSFSGPIPCSRVSRLSFNQYSRNAIEGEELEQKQQLFQRWTILYSSSASNSGQQQSRDDENDDEYDDENLYMKKQNENDASNDEDEETLLCMRFVVRNGSTVEDGLKAASRFCQSYPFAVVLPVQPLMYVPTPPTKTNVNGGVEIKFLRKKTPTKTSIDGGIRFSIEPQATLPSLTSSVGSSSVSSSSVPGETDENNDEDFDNDDDYDSTFLDDSTSLPVIEIIAKRNSKGQTIPKMFAEQLIVTSFVSCFSTSSPDTAPSSQTKNQQPKPLIQPPAVLEVISIYHKWM